MAAAIYVEARVAVEPVIPLRLFRDRTTSLATLASVLIGLAMFGSTVYLSQYFQLARGMSPTKAGLMSVAMVGGLLVSSIVSGRLITRHGRWKNFLVGGMVLVIVGLGLLATIDETTNLAVVGAFMAVLGLGLGATMQNLVLAVQNNVAQSDLGAGQLGGRRSSARWAARSGSPPSVRCSATRSPTASPRAWPGSASPVEAPAGTARSRTWRRCRRRCAQLFEQAFGEATGHLFLVAAAVRRAGLRVRAVHPRGAAAHHHPA